MKRVGGKLKFRIIMESALLICFLAGTSQFGLAADKSSKPDPGAAQQGLLQNDAPIHIASDRMEVDQNNKLVTFEGHVVVQQKELTITGKLMRVYILQKDMGSDSSRADRIDRIEVEGDVKISQQDKIATADKAVYYHEKQKIVLIGKPQFSQGQDTIKGRLITLYLPEQRTVVEGGESTPVHAVLYPERKEQ
ncbi:MAG: lipopolysaccharide transport periplasmic protein LptA [Desulforhabdus sp.]|jgi:lipopolysaccharide export system protein LptA|nr:lipopolysaccharide transport periplasmic protein LptA [Desulforhabdus sp.]